MPSWLNALFPHINCMCDVLNTFFFDFVMRFHPLYRNQYGGYSQIAPRHKAKVPQKVGRVGRATGTGTDRRRAFRIHVGAQILAVQIWQHELLAAHNVVRGLHRST
jgi:hypothetical protein